MRRRQMFAMRAAVQPENRHEEIKIPEAPQEMLSFKGSFKGLTSCPNCKKEMTRGIAMHYKHCIK